MTSGFIAGRRRGVGVLGGLLAVAVAAAGCTGSSSGKVTQSEINAKPTGPISWWVPGPDPTPGTLTGAAKAFTAKTGIKVNVDQSPWSTYSTKTETAITSGHGPDVIEIGNTQAATYSRTGGFLSWTPPMYKAIGGKGKFVSTSMKVTGAPGQAPISVPFMGQTWVMEYNKQLLRQAGLTSPPTTWSAFVKDAKKMNDPSKKVYGAAIGLGAPSGDATWDWIIQTQQGGGYYDSSGHPDITSKVDAKALASFLRWLYPDKIINPALVSDSTGTLATTEFERGQAAMLLTQNPQQAITNPGKYGIGYVPVPSPVPPGGSTVMSHIAGENLAIFKTTKHVSADLKFIKFLTSTGEQEAINKKMYELPTTSAGLNTPYFQTPVQKTFGKILTQHAKPMPTEASSNNLGMSIGNSTVQLARSVASSHKVSLSAVASALSKDQQTIQAQGAGGH